MLVADRLSIGDAVCAELSSITRQAQQARSNRVASFDCRSLRVGAARCYRSNECLHAIFARPCLPRFALVPFEALFTLSLSLTAVDIGLQDLRPQVQRVCTDVLTDMISSLREIVNRFDTCALDFVPSDLTAHLFWRSASETACWTNQIRRWRFRW